jgi:superfamily II DNA/RNA helicase
VDPPAEHKAYLHRSGRTARAGAEGVVVTVSTPEERNDTRTLMRQAGIKPTAVDVAPGHPAIVQLTGPTADLVIPAPLPARQPQTSGPGLRPSSAQRGSAAGRPQRAASGQVSAGRGRRGSRAGAAPSGRSGGLADFSAGRRGR